MAYYRCNTCNKVFGTAKKIENNKCPSCGGTNGEILSKETVRDGMERGTYFFIDPATGKGAKKKRR